MADAALEERRRSAYKTPQGGLTDLSQSMIRDQHTCGLKFQYRHIDQLPAPMDRGATIFGNVVHEALHEWYGMDGEDNAERHRDMDLPTLVAEQWPRWLPAGIWNKTAKTIEAAIDLDALEAHIRLTRPTIKGPRQTKQFLESDAFQAFKEAEDALIAACLKQEDIRWPKDEYPFRAYEKSLAIATRLQELWRPLPRPIAVERSFMLPMGDFMIKGTLDQLRADPDKNGEVIIDLRDVKTGRNIFTQMEVFVQGFLYYESVLQAEDLPTPDRVTFHNVRQGKVQHCQIEYERHKKLALRLLNQVSRDIISGANEPHYGSWCNMCDYKELCEQELSLWVPGTDGLTVEVQT